MDHQNIEVNKQHKQFQSILQQQLQQKQSLSQQNIQKIQNNSQIVKMQDSSQMQIIDDNSQQQQQNQTTELQQMNKIDFESESEIRLEDKVQYINIHMNHLQIKNSLKNKNFKDLVQDQMIFVLLILSICLIIYMTHDYFEANCQINSKQIILYCQGQDLVEKIVIEIFVHWLGLFTFLYYNFRYSFEIFYKELIFLSILFILITSILQLSTQNKYNLLWLLQFLIFVYYKYVSKIYYLNLIERIMYQQGFMLSFQLFKIIILDNQFKFSKQLIVIISNIYLAIQKKIVFLYFQQKICYNDDIFQEIHNMISILYMMDWALIFNSILKNEINYLIFSGFYLNFIQMVVFNLTDFHFSMYIVMKFLNWISKISFIQNLVSLIQMIQKFITQIWSLDQFINYLKLLKKKNYQYNTTQQKEFIEIIEIQRIFQSYYFISFIQFTTVAYCQMLINYHMPTLSTAQIIAYYNYNPNFVDGNIHYEVFNQENEPNPPYMKLIILGILFIISFACIQLYASSRKLQYFGYKDFIHKKNFFRIFFALYSMNVFNDICFR